MASDPRIRPDQILLPAAEDRPVTELESLASQYADNAAETRRLLDERSSIEAALDQCAEALRQCDERRDSLRFAIANATDLSLPEPSAGVNVVPAFERTYTRG